MTNATPKTQKKSNSGHFQRHVILGVLTVIPLLITWWVIQFLLGLLAAFGRPAVIAAARAMEEVTPGISHILLNTVFQSVAAVILVLLVLYLLGLLASQFVGRQIIALFNALISRIPLVEKVYGSVARMLEAFQQRPDEVQRVVLIEFPSPQMKCIGLVTKTMKDKDSGEELAAVFVPTTPNPTNGYLEVVPVDRLVPLDWTMDDAISFVISGGAVGPESMPYVKAADGEMRQAEKPGDPDRTAP